MQSILLKIPEQTGLTIISKHICTILSTLDIRILRILTILCRTLLRAVLTILIGTVILTKLHSKSLLFILIAILNSNCHINFFLRLIILKQFNQLINTCDRLTIKLCDNHILGNTSISSRTILSYL